MGGSRNDNYIINFRLNTISIPSITNVRQAKSLIVTNIGKVI